MSNRTIRVTSSRARVASWAPAVSWAATVAGLVGAIVVLHALGRPGTEIAWSDLPAWLGDHSTEQVALALTRVLALGAAYCLALGTSIDMFARVTGLPALVRSVEWATLPPVRRMAEKVAAVAIGAASMVPSLGVAAPLPLPDQRGVTGHTVVMVVDDVTGRPPVAGPSADPAQPQASELPITLDRRVAAPASSSEADPPPHLATAAAATVGPPPLTFLRQGGADFLRQGGAGVDPEAPTPGSPAALRAAAASGAHATAATPTSATSDHLVVPGEHLWGIAAGRLTAAHGRAPSLTETASYWSEIVAANRATLRSGDPDLIFPGETITCPPVSAGP